MAVDNLLMLTKGLNPDLDKCVHAYVRMTQELDTTLFHLMCSFPSWALPAMATQDGFQGAEAGRTRPSAEHIDSALGERRRSSPRARAAPREAPRCRGAGGAHHLLPVQVVKAVHAIDRQTDRQTDR